MTEVSAPTPKKPFSGSRKTLLATVGFALGATLAAYGEADTAELATLVEEILAFSRTGNRPPTPRQILLAELVESVLQREAAGASVEVAIPAGLTLTTDPVLLGRALGNLLRNALTHAGPDAAVTIRAEATATTVTITVCDNGPGVPAAELPRLFEPFYRVDRSRSRDTGSRNGPAGSGQPFMKPRPSQTTTSTSRASR